MENSDMPAMPQNYALHITGMGLDASSGQGLTKREYFAGLMMQSEKIHHGAHGGYSYSDKGAASEAVSAADALLAELEKSA